MWMCYEYECTHLIEALPFMATAAKLLRNIVLYIWLAPEPAKPAVHMLKPSLVIKVSVNIVEIYTLLN